VLAERMKYESRPILGISLAFLKRLEIYMSRASATRSCFSDAHEIRPIFDMSTVHSSDIAAAVI
jgi:hypothetical protein